MRLTLRMRMVIIHGMNPSRPPSGGGGERAAGTPAPAPGAAPTPRVSSRTLLGEKGELVIDHEGREYRLRITQNGKLILTA